MGVKDNMQNINNAKICVIGLGYVGLPLAHAFSEKYEVVGFDISKWRIDELSSGYDRTLELNETQVKEAIKNGASGYMLKNQSSDCIIESLRTVYKGSIVFEKEVAQRLTSMLKDDKKKQRSKLDITEREWDVLKLVGEGLTNKEIADKLYLSEGTVRNYVTMLLEKLCLRDRTQLAIYYVKNLE